MLKKRTKKSFWKPLKSLSLIAICASFMAFSLPDLNSTNPNPIQVEPCSMENNSFEVGEEIVYKLYYNWNFVWLSAGEVTFKVNDMDGQYHLSVVGRTYPSYEWFFKVDDHYDTYIDKNTLLPHTSIRDVHEGKYTLYDKVTFDQTNGIATSLRGKTVDQAVSRDYDIDNCMHDIVSIFYYCRNIEFDEYDAGQEFPIKIFMDKETWPLNVKYHGKESNKKVKGLGNFNTIKFSPEVISGEVFEEDTEMNIWVSDDKNRVPLLIESPVSVGSVKAVLKEYKGLKYDFESMLK